jgi:hypothetical protein
MYELKQIIHEDVSWHFKSLDDPYDTDRLSQYLGVALHNYKPINEGEIFMRKNHKLTRFDFYKSSSLNGIKQPLNGYFQVLNKNTKLRGVVPGYKIIKNLV